MAKIGDIVELVSYDHTFFAELRENTIEIAIQCPNDNCFYNVDIDRGTYLFVGVLCLGCQHEISIENPFPEMFNENPSLTQNWYPPETDDGYGATDSKEKH